MLSCPPTLACFCCCSASVSHTSTTYCYRFSLENKCHSLNSGFDARFTSLEFPLLLCFTTYLQTVFFKYFWSESYQNATNLIMCRMQDFIITDLWLSKHMLYSKLYYKTCFQQFLLGEAVALNTTDSSYPYLHITHTNLFVPYFNWVTNELIKTPNTVGVGLCLQSGQTRQWLALPEAVRN